MFLQIVTFTNEDVLHLKNDIFRLCIGYLDEHANIEFMNFFSC